MSQNFYNNLVLAMLGPQAVAADPSVALSPQLLYTYKALVANQTDLAKAYRSAETKQKLAELKNIVSIYSTAQKAQTAAYGEIAQSSRVSSQNIAKLKDGALKTLERATSKQTSVDKDKRRSIIEAGERRKATNNSSLKQNILYEATVTRFISTDPVDPDNTKALGTISDILQETVGAGLSDGDIVAKVRDFTEGSSLQNDIVQKIIEYKTAYDDIGFVVRKANSMIGSLNEYGKELEGVRAGAGGSQDVINASNTRLAQALTDYGETLKASERSARQSMEDTADFYKSYLSAAAQYEPVLRSLSDRIIGRDSSGSARGSLVSNPNFAAWAKDNGYNNLGYMSGGVYVEGADDTNAIYMFNYQRMNPDKYRPGIRRDLGDTDDLLVIEKAPSQKYLSSLATSEDAAGRPTYLFKLDDKGNKKFLKNDDPFFLLMAKGGTRIESTDNQNLMVNFKTFDLFDEDSDLYKALKEREDIGELTDEENNDITVEELQAYLSPSIIRATSYEEFDKRNKDFFNGIMGDTQLVKALGVNIVDIDGTVRSFKNTDELEAAIEGYDANKDKEYKFVDANDYATFFGMANEINETSDLPTEKRVIARQRMHAAENFTKDGVVIIGTDTDGEVRFDPSGKDGMIVVDSYDTSDLGRKVNIAEDPVKRFERAKIKLGQTDKKELEPAVEFTAGETDEEQEAREEETVLGLFRQSAGTLRRDEMRDSSYITDIMEGGIFDFKVGSDERPLLVGKSRRRQQREMQEEAAKERAKGLVDTLDGVPTSTADVPALQPYPGGREQFGVFMDTDVVPANVQRKLALALPSGDAAGLPRFSPLDPNVQSTQRTGGGLPSAISGPVATRLKVPTKASREFFPYDKSFGSELTPMSDTIYGMFAPKLKGQNVQFIDPKTIRRLQEVRKRKEKLDKLTPTAKVEEVTVPAVGVGSDEVTLLSGD